MRRFGFSARSALLAAALLFLACSREPSKTDGTDPVVARVNGTPITLRDLQEEMASRQGLSFSAAAEGTVSEVSEALRRLLECNLVLQEGRRLGVSVSEIEVEEEIRRYRSDFPPGGLEKILLQQGVGMEEWRARMRRSLLYRKSTEAIAGPLGDVEDEEVREAYRERPPESDPPERIRVLQWIFDTEADALAARRKLLGGSSPKAVVDRGAGGGTSPEVVDLGDLSRDDLPGEIAGELFGLPAGDVSGVVRRDHGYSLFLVAGRRESRERSFEEAAPRIRESLLREKREERLRAWIGEEMRRADVRVQEGLLEWIGAGRR